MAQIARPGREPGTLFITALGKTIKLVEWREDSFMDSVLAPAAAAGNVLEFFRDINNKNGQHANIRTPRRLPSGTEFILSRIGVVPAQAVGGTLFTDADMIVMAYNGFLSFSLDDRVIAEGPVYKFGSGFGVQGSTTRDATGVATIGVPSPAAASQLLVAQNVTERNDLVASLSFPPAPWIAPAPAAIALSAAMPVTLNLHGFIKKPR
jgi:hypothetical protein